MSMKSYLDLLRLPQWSKNLFIFLPLFFSLHILEASRLLSTTFAFISFSLLASGVYIFNDFCDLKEDLQHPSKRNRPLASGRVSKTSALILMTFLLVTGSGIALFLALEFFYLCLFYILLNLAYTLKLKHLPVLDITIISIGFVIRIFVGGVAAKVPIYMWIVIMTFLLAMFMALGKRRNDFLIYIKTSTMPRRAIEGYNLRFIDSAMMIMAAVVMVAYLMYTVSPEIMTKFRTDKLYLTAFFVLLGILRYLQITIVEENSGNPTEIFLKDSFIQVSILGWFVSLWILIYLK